MLRTIFYFFALFFLVRFVLRFVLPLLHITGETSRRIRHMQQRMNDMEASRQNTDTGRKKPTRDEYIEYEEVK